MDRKLLAHANTVVISRSGAKVDIALRLGVWHTGGPMLILRPVVHGLVPEGLCLRFLEICNLCVAIFREWVAIGEVAVCEPSAMGQSFLTW